MRFFRYGFSRRSFPLLALSEPGFLVYQFFTLFKKSVENEFAAPFFLPECTFFLGFPHV
jgi:hypothetical protein